MALIEIRKALADLIDEKYHLQVDPEITYPDPRFGDYASNIAFQLAPVIKKSPADIASELAESLSSPTIQEVTALNGFINIKMTTGYWIEQLHQFTGTYGSSIEGKGKKVQVEFISANPTGPLTLGNARGGFVGDVIGRVLRHYGYNVTSEYYFNDAGTQIRILVGSVKAAAGLIEKNEEHYPGDYIDDLADRFKPQLKGSSDKELSALLTSSIFEQWIKPSIDKMGVHFDEWFNESSLIDSGQFEEAIKLLSDKGLTYQKEGAWWLASSKFNDERDRVLIKSSGDVTYLGTDIAYHLNIFTSRSFDRSIKVWGADHAGQVPSLRLTMKQLVPDKQLDFVLMQWVRLMQGDKEVKMSKRAGTYVTVDELVDQVTPDVARFFFLQRSTDTAMDFDLDLAREQSQKNPLYYVMYSYARAHSILKQASIKGLAPVNSLNQLTAEEVALVRHISRFPNLLDEIVADYGVHRLTFFAIEAAKLFHDLYESERIIDLEKAHATKRLYTIEKYTQFMRLLLGLLGITPIDRMEKEPS